MVRFLFSFLPWWVFALFAVTIGTVAYQFYEDALFEEAEAEYALQLGPPDLTALRNYDPNRSVGPLNEVHLDGRLRADLGILNITFGETQYSFVLLDDTDAGPLVAILETTEKSVDMITNLVNNADATGQVAVNGFLAPSRVGEISRLLAVRGYSNRPLIVMEPYFGARAAVINDKTAEAWFIVYVFAGLTALVALFSAWRFRRWRKRRAARRFDRRPAAPKSAPQPAQAASSSPWDTFNPVDDNMAPAARKPGLVQPQSIEEQRRAQKQPSSVIGANRTAKPNAQAARKTKTDDAPIPAPEFESVFPGGGSGFRFKTADEIIRQSFGTLSTLTKVNRAED